MATTSPRFTWCNCRKHKIPVKDTHELCLHCLGIQHAKEAVLEYGKCPHCARMDWSTCINRLTKVQEVMHRENQQRKHEAAQSEIQPKPETTSAHISEPKTGNNGIPLPSSHFPTATAAHPSTMPVLFTILSPLPSSQTVSNPSSISQSSSFLTQLAIQQSADSTPSTMSQATSHALTSSSRKSRRFSSRRSRSRSKRCRGVGHRQRRSPSSSSSFSQCWTSGEEEESCLSGGGTGRRRLRRGGGAERRHSELMAMVQQRMDAQQQGVQLQWAMLEKRIETLERRRGVEAATAAFLLPFPTPQTERVVPQASTTATTTSSSSPSQQRDTLVMESTSFPFVKREEEPSFISSASRPLSDGGGDACQPAAEEGSVSEQDLLAATELQSLIARAARYLGVNFPTTSTDPCSPHDPTMVPEFEDLVQSSWQNPASSKPYRESFSKMYRLHDCQSAAYDQMPQVNCFMSAIFQAVKPVESRVTQVPSERWRFTETMVERMYQTAGMLAKTANYLRYLSDYQRRLLTEITEDHHAQRFVAVLSELKLIGQFTHQLSSHQAELSGRVMAASVAIRRQVWMAMTNYSDSLKGTVSDLPFVVSHTFGVGPGPSSTGTECKQEPS